MTISRKSLGCLAVAGLLLLAGCTSGLSLPQAEAESTVVEDVDLTIARNGTTTMAVTYESAPKIEEETCWFNAATKTTQCSYPDREVDVSSAHLRLSTDPESEADDRILSPVERNGRTVTFEYDSGLVTGVTIESAVVGSENGHEWGTASFGFEVDPSTRDYIVPNSTWYHEVF